MQSQFVGPGDRSLRNIANGLAGQRSENLVGNRSHAHRVAIDQHVFHFDAVRIEQT